MKHTIRRKGLSIVLALAMVMSLFPAVTLPAKALPTDHPVTLTNPATVGTRCHITAEDIFGAEMAGSLDLISIGFSRPTLSTDDNIYGDISYSLNGNFIGADGTFYGEVNGTPLYSEQDYYFFALTAGTYEFTAYLLNDSTGTDDYYHVTITVTASNAAPVIADINGDSVTFTEGGSAALLDSGNNAAVTDSDNADFNGGNLTASIATNPVPGEDVLSIANNGLLAGQIGVSGSDVTYGGTTIGTVTGGTGTNNLVVTFNTNATPEAATALIKALRYSNTNTTDPSTTARTVRVTVSDGSGGTSVNADVTVNVIGVNDAPTLSATVINPTFTEGGAAERLFSSALVGTVEAGQKIKQLLVTVSGLSDEADEVLIVDGTSVALTDGNSVTTGNGIDCAVTVSGTTATVTITKTGDIPTTGAGGADGLINWLAYRNTSGTPTLGDRVVTLTSIEDNGGTANSGESATTLSIASTVTVVSVPKVTSVTSTKDDGTYGIGETIDVKVTFSEPVTVDTTDGTPQLTLETGSVDRTSSYTGGSGSNTLTFTYTTQAGDETTDLDYVTTNPLVLNGGTIKCGTTNAALTLPAPGAAGSLGANKAIVIAAFPTVSLSVGSASITENGGTSTITATIPVISSQDVVVTLGYSGTATSGTDYNGTASTTITIPAGSLSASAAVGITATQDIATEGNETIVVSIVGVSKGVEVVEQQATITILDDDIPTVTNVTSSTANGSYNAGDTISIQVTFSAAVTVTGIPQLLLETGTTDRTIDCVSVVGNTITFNYTVQSGDNSDDLDYFGTGALTGTITSGGISASLTLPTPGAAGSLGANKAIVVDTTPPTATITVSDTALKVGETSAVTITFSEAVTGFATADMTAANGTLSDLTTLDNITWTVTLTPTADMEDTTNVITLDNTGVQDAAGNSGTGTTDSNNYEIDTNRPTATIVVSDGALKAGETSEVTITFSEAVTGFTTADLTVQNGTLTAVGSSDGGTTWTATLTTTAGITDSSNVITINMTGVSDAAGNTGTGTTDSNNYAIDTLRPTATIVVSDTTLTVGETSAVTITFSEAVTGFTPDDMPAANGTLSSLSSSDGGTTWTATFTPTADVEDATNVITLDNTGVQDAAGNTGTGTTDSNNYAIDTKIPTVTIIVSDTALKVGETSAVSITFSEAVTGFATDDMTVANGTLGGLTTSNNITWTATLTPTADIEDTTNVITLDNTGVQDAAGNTGTDTTESNNYAIDTIMPTVTSVAVPNDGKYKAGATLSFTVDFSEAVTMTGAPTLALDIGGAAVSAVYVSGNNTSALVFAYTIVDGNVDTNGIDISALGLNGGTIKDTAGNDASLTLNSVGSTAGVLVDTTAPTVGGGAIGVSELTHNSAKLTWTAATDPGTDPANLQYKVVYSTSNNIANLSDAKTNGTTFGNWTANLASVTVTGLTASTPYYFNVIIKDAAGNEAVYTAVTANTTAAPSSSGGTTTPPVNTVVEVNGQKQDAGTSSTQTTGGQTVTTIKVDDTKLDKILASSGEKPTVTLPTNKASDVVVGELNGQTVKNMEQKEAVLEIKTETVSYTLPAAQINIDDVSSQIGEQVALKDIKVSVKIAEPPADTVKIVENTAAKNSYQIVVKPVEFEITCTSGSKTVAVSKFNGYVERTVAIPDGIDPSKITTGIVLNNDGTFSHVPTQIVVINGKYFAKINSLTNSTYSVIYNPVTFADVASHWAKDAINDMGSRMVVTGIGGSTYEPERSITRAEFAAIVVRALGLRQGTAESGFGDVTLTDWFNGYVDTAATYALITGYDSGTFGPSDTITREQAMAIIARAMKLTGLDVTLTDSETATLLSHFTDGAQVSAYAKAGTAVCLKAGIVNGTTTSTISPNSFVTRAEVAVMVQRLLQESGLI